MKIKALALTLALSVSSINAYAGGIPTFDGAAVANMLQQVTHTLTQIDNQIQQIEEAKNQIKQAEKQFDSMTGNRNLGQILNDSGLRDYLPESSDLYSSHGRDFENIKSKEDLKAYTDAQERYLNTLYENKSKLSTSYEQTSKRFNNIENLMKAINETQDPKAAADLSNRIAAENAIIQTEQTKLAMLVNLQEQETKLAEQQKTQEFKKLMFK